MEAKQAVGHARLCRHCNTEFIPKQWQLNQGFFECNACIRAKKAEWRARRKAEGRPVISTRMPLDYHRAYATAYFQDPVNRERRNALMRAYTKAEGLSDRHRARWLTRRAIDSGRLVRQPCEVCGAEKVQAHHDDYTKPLDVRWLCLKHHYEHHTKATKQGE